jgi:hypothetical protein
LARPAYRSDGEFLTALLNDPTLSKGGALLLFDELSDVDDDWRSGTNRGDPITALIVKDYRKSRRPVSATLTLVAKKEAPPTEEGGLSLVFLLSRST